MVRKLGTYKMLIPANSSNCKHMVEIKLKLGVNLQDGQIVTDDMIEDYKDPLWFKLVDVICWNRDKNNGEMADAIIDLIDKNKK